MEWSDHVESADWWIERLQPFSDHVVGSMVPAGFESITRIFHPIEHERGGTPLRWSEVAKANARVAHPEMQLHRIASRTGDHLDPRDAPGVEMGSLPPTEMRALASILLAQGSTGPVWFGFSTIDSTFDTAATAGVKPVGERSRQYFLIRGSLAKIDDVCRFANQRPLELPGVRAPNVWWPDDKSWYVISEFDFAWTYVAGSPELIAAIETSPELEALRADYDHSGTVDADKINGP